MDKNTSINDGPSIGIAGQDDLLKHMIGLGDGNYRTDPDPKQVATIYKNRRNLDWSKAGQSGADPVGIVKI